MASFIDDVLITDDLKRRPARPPDYAAENLALAELAEGMADSPQTILQKLVETALNLCRADSAGISIFEPNGGAGVFRWHAIAGQFASKIGGGMPREGSPCGLVLDRDSALLFSYPERYFNYGQAIDPPIVEALLVPFHSEKKPVGTLWVIAHTTSRQFDAEDQRLLTSLSRFASVAYQTKTALVMTETGLKAKTDEVRRILDSAAIGLTRCSRDLRYLSCNPAYEKLAGLSADQIVGRPIIDVMGPEAFEVIRPHVERVLRGERVEYEEEVPFAARGPRFLHVVYEPWFDCEGQVTGWIASVSDITGLKRTTNALRESEERLRLAMSSGTIGVWDWDARNSRLTASPEVGRIYSLDVTKPVSFEDFRSRVHPDDLAKVESVCDAALRNHQPFDTDFRILLPSGEIRWIASRGQAYYDENGHLARMVANNIDITEHIQAKEALREREQRLRLALDASGAGSWSRDDQTGHIDWDDRFRELYGLTAGEPASFETWLSRIHEEDRRQVLELVDQLQRTKTQDTFDITFRVVRPDGTMLWIQSLGQANRDADGRLMQLTGLELDITERRRNEEALHDTEARLREFLEVALRRTDSELTTILKAAPIGIVTMDRDGKVTTWNDAAERIFGYGAEEVIGRINPAIPDDALAGFRESISDVMKGATIQTEVLETRKEGSVIAVSLVRAPHYDEYGTVKGVITLVEDITAKRKAENDLARVRSALAEVQVEESRRIARELHDDIAQRLALLSFDIERMVARPPDSHEELVENFRSCQQKIVDIGEGLRQISHRMHPAMLEHLGLSKAMEHLCRDFSRREGIPVKFHSDELTTDVSRTIGACFYRVAQEALRNISKHAKGADVEVQLAQRGQTLQLCVADSGSGFDTSAVKSGLGLHSMRERTELVNGSFSVTSERGSGTRIVISVPLHESYRPSTLFGHVVPSDEQINCQTKKCRLLIGDDHPLFASGIAKLLEETHEVVGMVGDGLALVRAAEQLNPELVLLDISMPVMNGFDAAREIRRSVPAAKLLFLTTYSSPAYADEAFKSGADGYLVKHAALSELPIAIATVLQGYQYRSPQIGKQLRGTA
jgi:PAS domain S-box-containing protein